jgi:HK97 family phage prohead protease
VTDAERLAELDGLELDLYLEQRVLYRRLVAECGHRGVRPPAKPRYLSRQPLQSVESKPRSRGAPLLARTFELQIDSDNGRTIEARIVPYNTPTRVIDLPKNGGTGEPYEETWLPGAFEQQLRGQPKVWLNFEHEKGLQGIVGHALELRDERDGLHGAFRVHDNSDGNKALHLIRENVLTGVSLEAHALHSVRRNGVVERVKAHLDKVALCRSAAYAAAQVLAIRER